MIEVVLAEMEKSFKRFGHCNISKLVVSRHQWLKTVDPYNSPSNPFSVVGYAGTYLGIPLYVAPSFPKGFLFMEFLHGDAKLIPLPC